LWRLWRQRGPCFLYCEQFPHFLTSSEDCEAHRRFLHSELNGQENRHLGLVAQGSLHVLLLSLGPPQRGQLCLLLILAVEVVLVLLELVTLKMLQEVIDFEEWYSLIT